MKITDYLPTGKENAIPSKTLAEILGFDTVRELQKAIERERQAGAVILSTCTEGGGYFLPANETEIREFIRTLSNRAKNTRRSMESALDALDGMTGQMRL
ncbi:hypothetical protein H8S45_10680 [Agathobaculum sp. NSJ-28]|uniref:Uncharacterized protein n=1 Tax=Agathobaculum faecis TaxID=2763013 RepID=A0A923LVH1_9FIRM|nr:MULTISPECIES: hypothetical protein [Butyricicoccaceae]MBC5725919.1 hypothetical protein [Agathobaculum faecis]MBS6882334.1 hypothetical protein [Clostridiaceae bacterium]WOC74314.1 hypothetical protein RX717_09805 [Intestinibacillus sp. NTUH-41-i26]